MYYYQNGHLHNIDGPAIIINKGYNRWEKHWYLYDNEYTSAHSFCDAAGIHGEDRCLFILKWGSDWT
jgi:hypothetical protein